MENLIKQVIDLEQKGKYVVELAREREATIDAEIEENINKLHTAMITQMKKRIRYIHKIEDEETAEKVKEIQFATEKTLADIRQRFDKNKNTWQDELFKKIIGR